jgi:hypothetical protein
MSSTSISESLICPCGHRGPFDGDRCAARVGPNGHPRRCGERLIPEPELAWCASCRRGLYVDNYCTFCGHVDPMFNFETRSEHLARKMATACVMCGRAELEHSPDRPFPSLHTFRPPETSPPAQPYRDANNSDLQPIHTNGSSGSSSRTRSKGGRPRLTKIQATESRARRRAKDRERKRAIRSKGSRR